MRIAHKRASQRQIARLVGVSQFAVSKALRGDPDLGAGTRQRILATAAELGYRPNRLMTNLYTGRTKLLGAIFINLGAPFFHAILHGEEREAFDNQYNLIPVQALNDAPTDEREVNLLLQNRVDGLLTGPRCNRENERFYADLLRQGEKIVFIDQRMPMPDACNVFSDDLTGSRLAMEHLFSLGHRAIAHLGSAGPGLSSSASLRQQGYVNAMAAAGFESPPHWLLRVADGDVAAAVAELLHRSPEITAFFCFNDGRALELLDAVEGLGRRVPDDISIVGYGDNIAHARYLKVPLTTVAQDGEVIGRAATRLLLRMLNGEQGLAGDHLQPVRLIERASTCPCRQVKRPSR